LIFITACCKFSSISYELNREITMSLTCTNCHEAPMFTGFDTCIACAVAIALSEQPEYLAWAKRVYANDPAWLSQLETEWLRQSPAPTPTYSPGFMTRRQA
jgi:hypothetical protein